MNEYKNACDKYEESRRIYDESYDAKMKAWKIYEKAAKDAENAYQKASEDYDAKIKAEEDCALIK